MPMEDGTLSFAPNLRRSIAHSLTSRRTTVKDKLHGQNVALTEDELDLIHRLAKGENPDAAYDP